jgi:hypothetical protein
MVDCCNLANFKQRVSEGGTYSKTFHVHAAGEVLHTRYEIECAWCCAIQIDTM